MKKLIMITMCLMTLILSGCSLTASNIDMDQKPTYPIVYTSNEVNRLYSVLPSQSEDNTLPNYCNVDSYATLPVNYALGLKGEETTACGDYYRVDYNNKDYYISKDSVSNETVDSVDYSNYYNHEYMADNIYIDGVVPKEQAEKIYYYLSMVPENIVEQYEGRIIITTNFVNVVTGIDNYAMTGGYDRNSQDIYLCINDLCSILHEMGHFYYHNLLSDKSGLTELLTSESDYFHPHYRQNENEYFAECFRRTVIGDEQFKKDSPKSYEFVADEIQLEENKITFKIG